MPSESRSEESEDIQLIEIEQKARSNLYKALTQFFTGTIVVLVILSVGSAQVANWLPFPGTELSDSLVNSISWIRFLVIIIAGIYAIASFSFSLISILHIREIKRWKPDTEVQI